jgi:hypothetical protein
MAMALVGASAMAALAQTAASATHQHQHPMAPELGAAAIPELPGQDAFGAIQEIVRILEADPATDWSKVDIDALRDHLIDMNELTLHANVDRKPIAGGLRMEVTGDGRTVAAIQRMVAAHARQIDGTQGWTVKTELSRAGIVLTVTASDPAQTAKIRGLGFMGIMSLGAHHQRHHLAIAKGELVH